MQIALTIVIPGAQAPLGQLHSIDFGKCASDLKQALTESESVEWAVLAVDISLNDDTAKDLGTYWQVHYHGFASVTDKSALLRSLQDSYPITDSVSRPVHTQAFDGSRYGASYTLKPDGYRRVAYWDANAKAPCWNTVNPAPALRPREHVEYLLTMHRLGFNNRILLYRVKTYHKGHLVMVKKLE